MPWFMDMKQWFVATNRRDDDRPYYVEGENRLWKRFMWILGFIMQVACAACACYAILSLVQCIYHSTTPMLVSLAIKEELFQAKEIMTTAVDGISSLRHEVYALRQDVGTVFHVLNAISAKCDTSSTDRELMGMQQILVEIYPELRALRQDFDALPTAVAKQYKEDNTPFFNNITLAIIDLLSIPPVSCEACPRIPDHHFNLSEQHLTQFLCSIPCPDQSQIRFNHVGPFRDRSENKSLKVYEAECDAWKLQECELEDNEGLSLSNDAVLHSSAA